MYIEYLKKYKHLVAIKNMFLAGCGIATYYCMDPEKGIGWFIAIAALFAITFELVAITTAVATKRATEEEIRSQEQ
ncbi:hypothetical protein R5N14_001003 [Citrobacter freundii]|nr:hypothetical protein [Citrobacter freundii]